MRRNLLAPAIALALLTAACGGDGEPEADVSPTTSPTVAPVERPSSPAELTILEPRPGETVGQDALIVLELDGAEIAEEVSTDLDPAVGHIHLMLDGETIQLLGGLRNRLSDMVEEPVPPGPHLLEAEFVAADHGPWDPRIVESVNFTIEG